MFAVQKLATEIAHGKHAFERMDVNFDFAWELFLDNPFKLHFLDRTRKTGLGAGKIENCLSLIGKMFGFVSYEFALSTCPENYMGKIAKWDEAEAALKDVLNSNWNWVINKGDGEFYGPKIDAHVQDALGHKLQTVTIQLDFQLPQ
ncbi:hypothetical protein IW148_005015 [Coemansia sp. RSA 1199]|nr:hypothetical protein IW148_005015 [Coemansia sp. RSA 1199]